jgi:uncharacterized caspase-like protein
MRLPFAAMGDLLTMTRIRSLVPFGLSAIPLALPAVAGLTSFAPSRAQDAARGKKYALLIAVDRYEKGSLLPSLPFPRRDVEDLARLFVEAGYDRDNVTVMTKERGLEDFDLTPTAEHIRNQLGLLLDQLKPGDSVIVGLGGHGVLMRPTPVLMTMSFSTRRPAGKRSTECGSPNHSIWVYTR